MESFKEPDYSNLSFEQLAQDDSEFGELYKANHNWIDFQNPQMAKQLTKSLLKRDFALKLELPDDRLCPPVPIRYQYIQFIASLLNTTHPSLSESPDPTRPTLGIDIGVGASCIYPLLGCAAHPNWRFKGTDIDLTNLFYARKNVETNNLKTRISVLDVSKEQRLLPWEKLFPEFDGGGEGTADFVMCNPPFYESKEAMEKTFSKESSPSAVCTGEEVEMICEGGDAGFTSRILEESVRLGEKVQWYTVMMGRLESVEVTVKKLKEKECHNWVLGTLKPGGKTRRWVVGWSWGDLRPSNGTARGDIPNRELLPFPTEFHVDCKQEAKVEDMGAAIDKTMAELDLKWEWSSDTLTGTAFIKQDVWSRSARRKKRKADAMEGVQEATTPSEKNDFALVMRIKCLAHVHSRRVEVRLLKGTQTVLFESFCGMLKRKVLEKLDGK